MELLSICLACFHGNVFCRDFRLHLEVSYKGKLQDCVSHLPTEAI